MPHSSGNATWVDWPLATTPITAATLEAVENTIDTLAVRPSVEARLTADYVNLGNSFYTLQGQMAVVGTDPFNMFQQPSGVNTNYQVVIPAGWAGRYAIYFNPIFTNVGTTTCTCVVLKNVTDTANGATPVGTSTLARAHGVASGATAHPHLHVTEVLAAGDKLAFSVSTGIATWTLTALQNGFSRTRLSVRYVGPV